MAPATAMLLLVTGFVGCEGNHPSAAVTQAPVTEFAVPPNAEVAECIEAAWPTIVQAQGSLQADEEVVVGAKVAGRVAETLVELGDLVIAGQPLLRLEQSDFDLRVEQAEAQLAEACALVGTPLDATEEPVSPETVPYVMVEKAIWEEATEALERMRRLQKTNSISLSELDKQVSVVRVAKAKYESSLRTVEEQAALIRSRRVALAIARQSKEDATVCTPFRGSVRERHLAAGSIVQAGMPLFTVVRIDPLRFHGRVPERKAAAVRIGQAVRIIVEGVSDPIQATVSRISPVLDLASRSLQVEVDVPNPDQQLRAGLFATGAIEVDSHSTALAVPTESIGEFAGVYKVWLVEGETMVPRQIQLGRMSGELTEVTSGLSPGERVLRSYDVGELSRRGSKNATVAESET